jgi:hypothetical protein
MKTPVKSPEISQNLRVPDVISKKLDKSRINPPLLKDLRVLCAKVAHERTRRVTWTEGAALRREAVAKLACGADLGDVEQWLLHQLRVAVAGQVAP